ncbi:ABC transporter ATP-binding protein [Trueperella pyogenes]|uniref:ABC transporter ATP-binding protein n=1 Tax=Trueperella pyogenes TaxID=1661 RepID=UPI00345CF276
MNAIEINKLIKHYGKFEALKGIDLAVNVGEVFGFLGPNGAGKSTTIRTMLDEIRATSGTITIVGLDSHRDVVEVHRRIGYLPSDLALFPKMTGRATLTFFANLRGSVDWKYVEHLSERFDANLDKRTGELSTGNRQKIGLIAAFMHKPELLIMDEPIVGLDPLIQHEFHKLIRETVNEGRTVFLSSHTLSEVQRVADRVGIIRQGEIVAVENIGDLKAVRQARLVLAEEPTDLSELESFPGVHGVSAVGATVRLNFQGEIGSLIDAVSRRNRIVDLTAAEADLEEVFLTFYQEN